MWSELWRGEPHFAKHSSHKLGEGFLVISYELGNLKPLGSPAKMNHPEFLHFEKLSYQIVMIFFPMGIFYTVKVSGSI